MTQTYKHPLAIERMREGSCPECGRSVEAHGGWGGPGCSLTDNGVADRIEHQRRLDSAAKAVRFAAELEASTGVSVDGIPLDGDR